MTQTKVQSPFIAAGAVGTNEIASGVTITGSLNGNASTVTNGVYTTDFAAILSGNGYQRLPGGLMMQWGNFTLSVPQNTPTLTIIFPTAFTSICYNVQINVAVSGSPPSLPSDGSVSLAYPLPTATQFTAAIRPDIGNDWVYYWFAIGI